MAVQVSKPVDYEQTDPDVRRMLDVRDGDAHAFEELVAKYQDRLLNVMRHVVGSADIAEDLVQDVFLRVYRARKTYRPGAKFSTWLFTIANNVAANAIRSRVRRKEIHLQGSPSGSQPVATLDHLAMVKSGLLPARQLDKLELQQIVAEALTELNDRQRMAVLLNKYEGMSYAEIAETMSLSPQAVKSLLARARVALREILEPYLESGSHPTDKETIE